ncbi:SHOCT domain-containing protein [Catenibacterium mitsuokai]|uniref:SHOCT domain-containing protein n=1 Tax=Catenibacterium mitsuokai TaxID=100886 RepID=UPI003F8E64B9
MSLMEFICNKHDAQTRKNTFEDMQSDFDYDMAKKLSHTLLEQGLITEEEFDHLEKLNICKFKPYLSELM